MSTLPCIIAGVSSSAAPAMVNSQALFSLSSSISLIIPIAVGPFSAAMRTTSGVSSSGSAEGAVEFSGSAVGCAWAVGSALVELSAAEALSTAEEALSGALTWGALWQAVSIRMQRNAASADLIFLVILMIPILSLFPRRAASSRPPSQSLPGAYPAFRTAPIRRPSGRQGQR